MTKLIILSQSSSGGVLRTSASPSDSSVCCHKKVPGVFYNNISTVLFSLTGPRLCNEMSLVRNHNACLPTRLVLDAQTCAHVSLVSKNNDKTAQGGYSLVPLLFKLSRPNVSGTKAWNYEEPC